MTLRPTSICNRKCNFCLCGEPTTKPPGYYKLLFESKCRLFWHTNGILLDAFFDFLSLNTDYVSLSLLAHTPELYSAIAGTRNGSQIFDTIVKNAKLLCSKQNYHGIAQAKLLVTREIQPHLEQYYLFYKSLGFDKIRFSTVKNYEPGQTIGLTGEEKDQVFHTLADTIGIRRDLSYRIVYGAVERSYMPSRCRVCELGLYATVEPDGRIFPCSQWCWDSSVCIGNINDTPFDKAWNSERRREIIHILNNRMLSGKCNLELCRHYLSNAAIDLYMKGLIKEHEISKAYFPFI